MNRPAKRNGAAQQGHNKTTRTRVDQHCGSLDASDQSTIVVQDRTTVIDYSCDFGAAMLPFRLSLNYEYGTLLIEGGRVVGADPTSPRQHLRLGIAQHGTHVARRVLQDALRLLDEYERRLPDEDHSGGYTIKSGRR